MKKTKKAIKLLEKIAKIERMERGKICQMKNRQHFNHQTWKNGANVVRYVPKDELEALQADIDSYNQFMDLVQQYADEIIRITRLERKNNRKA
ncbi:hypothetical protein SMSP2_02393 [Limihaloglobus sulfuriphilus]|uniref:Uncharacterized protein n=2 Tax=Limihaloglobus sulfuriphilus TaxID=1851148 RepID=A0A1Q2MHA6_9BACT|nr:hypothetical protein SMSP2_01462 [Limihaloglobus sulfuriphilus]AQQ71642.1 hypothetical protein SMSP2_02019 [Limihaloglobus sulfuriphilus]AQQ71982.1 hypothetical protein SMSP2_02361 [Limihaloglobus sulfuriphilus]AQQ72014.1 hypothetical protein SMSP2_02393 [Limihaloglobus sulfuriphilus]